jgi:uncharacterized membrane protein
MMDNLYCLLLSAVIVGHLGFAVIQWTKWEGLCAKITNLTPSEAKNTIFLGRSIGSYNEAIAVGLIASMWLEPTAQPVVQGVTLALIVATAVQGARSTNGSGILVARVLPAAAALAVLIVRHV